MRCVSKEQDAVEMYVRERLSVTKVSKRTGVPEKQLREILRGKGLLRNVGQQKRDDLDATKIRVLRKQRKLSWAQITQGIGGVSENAVMNAYRRAYGDTGKVDLYAHLTGLQAAELGHMWDTLPLNGNKGKDTNSRDARILFELVAFHHRRGVTYAECGKAIGISGAYLGRLVKERI